MVPERTDHKGNLKKIVERFNAMLAQYKLGPFEPTADDRNIYRQATELCFEINDHRLLLEVPDTWLEEPTNMLDCYLGQTIALNLKEMGMQGSKGSSSIVEMHHKIDRERGYTIRLKLACGHTETIWGGASQQLKLGDDHLCQTCTTAILKRLKR
jgi:hypothetical protein